MPRFFADPNDPLARFRLLAMVFALATVVLNIALFAFATEMSAGYRVEGIVAAALLGAWWLAGYRRGGFPAIGWLVDTVLVVLVAAWSPMPLHAIGVFYGGIQLRALYAPSREVFFLPLSYAVARVVSVMIGPPDILFGPLSASTIVQVFGLSVIAMTLHMFVEATSHHAEIERELKHGEQRYRLVAGAMHDVVYDLNMRTFAIEWTESMQHVFGFTPEQAGTDPRWWYNRVHPDDREKLKQSALAVFGDASVNVTTVRYRVLRADDTYAHVSGTMIVERDAAGKAERVVGSIRDVTSEQQLEEQLRQAQKMEAVGQLAGGVAHDFNNLLTVIGGHVYLLELGAPRNELTERHLGGITRAAERAAKLTKQLLAFSSKQLLIPTVLNMNAVVDDVVQMMRPVIGEHIQVLTKFESDLLPVFADPGQLAQVLVNLALNARDAMPSGGTLTIETSNVTLDGRPSDDSSSTVPAGTYVRLIVRDSGEGMEPATLARAFEPFFTTKSKGLGSGLGLATVYGIVRQSSGDIRAVSTPGVGTQFTILLPVTARAAAEGEPRRVSGPAPSPRAAPHHGDILLVEDDDGVREFAREVLSGAGYRVHAAGNGADALQKIESQPFPIDMVVTDVVMPEMGGRELVEQLRRDRPELPVLYITGYTDDPRMLGALHSSDVRLLGKPFTASALQRAVEEMNENAPMTQRSA